MGRGFRAGALRVDFVPGTIDDRLMKTIFDERRPVLSAPQPLGVGFILGKEQLGRPLAGQPGVAQLMMLHMHKTDVFLARWLDGAQHRSAGVCAPGPGVAEPERGKQVQRCRLWSTIGGAHPDQDVKWIHFGVFHRDIEVAVFRKDARVHQFVLEFIATTMAIGGDKIRIREGALGILVQRFHVRMRRGVVEKVVIFLHIFAVVPL